MDHEERPVSTTLEPYILLNEFALLRVNYVNQIGAFMDWGLEKDLLVPFREQNRPMIVDQWYVIFVYRDFFNHSPDDRIKFFVKKDSNNIMSGLKIFFYANEGLNKIKLIINDKESEVDISCDSIVDLGVNFLELRLARLLINKEQVDILKSIDSIKYASIVEGNV